MILLTNAGRNSDSLIHKDQVWFIINRYLNVDTQRSGFHKCLCGSPQNYFIRLKENNCTFTPSAKLNRNLIIYLSFCELKRGKMLDAWGMSFFPSNSKQNLVQNWTFIQTCNGTLHSSSRQWVVINTQFPTDSRVWCFFCPLNSALKGKSMRLCHIIFSVFLFL